MGYRPRGQAACNRAPSVDAAWATSPGPLTLNASLHAGAYLRGGCAPLVGDSRSSLGGRALARGEDSNFKALGQRFGLHILRHCLSNWLVNKANVEPKTVQGILRHSKVQTTLDLYTQEDSDETRAAQGEFLTAVGMNAVVN